MYTQLKLSSRKLLFAILVAVMAVFVTFGALYRTSSQGDSSETYPKGFRGGACTIETEALTVGYSGYYLPDDYEAPENTIRSAYIPVQCGRIPKPGMLNISIDLLYPESAREIPLALRLVKIEIDNKERQTEFEILSVSAQQHPSGVVTQLIKLSQRGQYILYLDGKKADNTNFQVKIHLTVGSDWKDHLKNFFDMPKKLLIKVAFCKAGLLHENLLFMEAKNPELPLQFFTSCDVVRSTENKGEFLWTLQI